MPFRNSFSRDIFYHKYAHSPSDTWEALASRLVDDVCGSWQGKATPLLPQDELQELVQLIATMKFIPGGRYLYYAGRPMHAWNNCFLLRGEEDTREEWGRLLHRSSDCLMLGGGIGIDYSVFREKDAPLTRTGGKASGPIPLMKAINELGRNVMQGGSRRSAIYASLNWQHPDIQDFLTAKNWDALQAGDVTVADLKRDDFNFPAPLDMTNISVNYDTKWLEGERLNEVFMKNVAQALRTGEPGFSFNFYERENETLRNAPVSADTWVLTADGYHAIREIVGIPTQLWTGRQWATATFKKTASNAPIVKVGMTGGRSIKAEPSHEFLVERWTGKGKTRTLTSIDRVPAGELKLGDILHTSLPQLNNTSLQPKPYTVGFVFGDGYIFKQGLSEITVCAPNKSACIEKFAANHIRKQSVDGRGYRRIYFDNLLCKDLRKDLVPRYTNSEDKCSFLAGLFDADGNYDSTQHRVRLSAQSRGFLGQVQMLLEEVGIKSTINKGSKSGYRGTPTFMLVVMAEDISTFARIIPCQRLDVQPHKPYRASKIKVTSLSVGMPEDVYCCDVGVEEHSFCAEGVIISNCTEVCSEDDSDVCNLGSLNLANIETLSELDRATFLASKFLVCGTTRATLPYPKVYEVREKNRRLGLGLMGIHEWLLRRGHNYQVVPELHEWLNVWKEQSELGANKLCDELGLNRPVAYRAIAPTGTIGILAGTTTGIEPLFAVAYKRRYLSGSHRWKYQFVVDSTAEYLIKKYGLDPDSIETASSLAPTPERRIKFQADIQDYVDQSISSTINLPAWGSDHNNPDTIDSFASTLAHYAPRLRGFTVYPDGSRGGQPLTSVPYNDAAHHRGVVFEENDICTISGKGGSCGV